MRLDRVAQFLQPLDLVVQAVEKLLAEQLGATLDELAQAGGIRQALGEDRAHLAIRRRSGTPGGFPQTLDVAIDPDQRLVAPVGASRSAVFAIVGAHSVLIHPHSHLRVHVFARILRKVARDNGDLPYRVDSPNVESVRIPRLVVPGDDDDRRFTHDQGMHIIGSQGLVDLQLAPREGEEANRRKKGTLDRETPKREQRHSHEQHMHLSG